MRAVDSAGSDGDPRRHRSDDVIGPVPHPPSRREALELLATLIAMLGVIFVLALMLGAGPLGQA
jgi:hypothetical protein